MKAKDLIDELGRLTSENTAEAEKLKVLPLEMLRRKPDSNSWSALECVEHLCRYGRFYLPKIRNRLEQSIYKSSETFRPGLIGDYFAKSMWPDGGTKKMKAMNTMNPINCCLNKEVLAEFIQQQHEILALLDLASKTNLTIVKTSISISRWIKLRLGDTLRVVIYHNYRHILQAKRTLQ